MVLNGFKNIESSGQHLMLIITILMLNELNVNNYNRMNSTNGD